MKHQMSENGQLGGVLTLFGAGLLLIALGAGACAALSSVTPADRASAYAREGKAVSGLCKAYAFDRASGLVGDVPEMARVCGASK